MPGKLEWPPKDEQYAIELTGEFLGPYDLQHVKDILRDGELVRVWRLVEVHYPYSELDV